MFASDQLAPKNVNRIDWSPRYIQEWKLRKLFPERPEIPGRRNKAFLACTIAISMYMYLYSIYQDRKKSFLLYQSRNIYERVRPFVQALDDVKVYAAMQKNEMVYRAMLEQDHPGAYNYWIKRYIQDITLYAYKCGETGWGKGFHSHGLRYNSLMPLSSDDSGLWGKHEMPFS